MISIRKLWPQPPRGSISYLHLSGNIFRCGKSDHCIAVQWNICTSKFSCSKLADNGDRRCSWDSNKEVFTRKKGPKKYLQLCKISRSWGKDQCCFCVELRVWACPGQIMKSLSAQIIEMTDTFPWDPPAAANIHTEHSSHGSIELELTRARTRAN